MAKNSRYIKYAGILDLGGFEIACYILEDSTRILSARGMQRALKIVDEDTTYQVSGARLLRYLNQKTLNSFIYKDKLDDHYKPITCYQGDRKINGYKATVLADICSAFLEARESIELSARQIVIAKQCEILIRAFAKVGIDSLIDEATGYQYERERFELQKILKTYISEEILKWQLTFTNDFYKQIFKLWGIPFTSKNIKRKPQFIGKITNKYVYELLPSGVLEVLKDKTPRSESGNYQARLHQSLSPEVGREHLKKQITEVTLLMEISDDKNEFQWRFKKKYNTDPQRELELDFKKDKITKRSKFDENLQQALDFNPSN